MKRVRFSIKMRFALLAALIVAMSSALWGGWVWQNEKRTSRWNFQEKKMSFPDFIVFFLLKHFEYYATEVTP